MTNIRFLISDGCMFGFEAQGHSGFEEYGMDIVCAAISAVTQYTAILAEDVLKFENAVYQDEYGAFLSVKIRNGNNEWYDIVKGLNLYLTELQKEYPSNLKITYTEVQFDDQD